MRHRSETHLLFAVACLCLVAGCRASIDDMYTALPAIGSPLPTFEFPRVSGGRLTTASDSAAPTIVALWSSTCSASRLALESLAALEAAYSSRGDRVVILADDAERDIVSPLLTRANFHGAVGLANGTLVRTFTHQATILPWRTVFALPTFFVLAPDGRVVYRQVGIEQSPSDRLHRVRATTDSLLTQVASGSKAKHQ